MLVCLGCRRVDEASGHWNQKRAGSPPSTQGSIWTLCGRRDGGRTRPVHHWIGKRTKNIHTNNELVVNSYDWYTCSTWSTCTVY